MTALIHVGESTANFTVMKMRSQRKENGRSQRKENGRSQWYKNGRSQRKKKW